MQWSAGTEVAAPHALAPADATGITARCCSARLLTRGSAGTEVPAPHSCNGPPELTLRLHIHALVRRNGFPAPHSCLMGAPEPKFPLHASRTVGHAVVEPELQFRRTGHLWRRDSNPGATSGQAASTYLPLKELTVRRWTVRASSIGSKGFGTCSWKPELIACARSAAVA